MKYLKTINESYSETEIYNFIEELLVDINDKDFTTKILIMGDMCEINIYKGLPPLSPLFPLIFKWSSIKNNFLTFVDFIEDWGTTIRIIHQYGYDPTFTKSIQIEKSIQDNSGIKNIKVYFKLPKNI